MYLCSVSHIYHKEGQLMEAPTEHDLRHASWGGCESDGQQALC